MIILTLYICLVLLVVWLVFFLIGKILGMPIKGIANIINMFRRK